MLRDQVMQERSLDLFYDTAPNPFEVALFDDDPDLGGVELSGNGYARGTVDTADWAPAGDGVKTTSPIVFADPTGEWVTATHVGLYDPVLAAWADVVPLAEPLDVTGAGDGPEVAISVFYDNNLD
jgi:hypothetical protein